MARTDLIATAAFGLESQVAYELKQLGYEDQQVEQGRVTFSADAAAIARANLWLRVADRVLYRVGEFPAKDFDALYDQVRALPWGELMPVDACFPVDGKSVKSQLSSVPAVQSVTKKAIVDALAARYGQSQLPETGPRYKVLVSLLNDVATLTIDTSGEGLHKRGYRTLVATAPLKETLAAGLISLARWRPERPFADPLCGSGTLPIEAALIGLNVAPGKFRRFDAENWPFVPASVWREARHEAIAAEKRDRTLLISGSDVDAEVLDLARLHAKQAGVGDRVRFERRPVADFTPAGEYGVIVTNPPYGERLSEAREVEQLYREMGAAFSRASSWSVYVLTAFEQFERFYGKQADKKRKLYNGRIRCDLYQYLGPRPPRPERPAE
ncbi:MAG TPA: class I SAM-dependent RNA methyltransferase [Oscillatoriaceae cyanobacterium]